MEGQNNPRPPRRRLPPNSGTRADVHSVNIDEMVVIPDSPDRVSRQSKNIDKGYGGSSSRSYGVADESILDKRGQLFGDTCRKSVHSSPVSNFGNVSLTQGAEYSVVPSSTGGDTLMDAIGHLKHQHKEGQNVSYSNYSGLFHLESGISDYVMVGNGEPAKDIYKSSREELEAVKTNKVYRVANNGEHTAGGSSRNDRNVNKGKAKVDSNTLKDPIIDLNHPPKEGGKVSLSMSSGLPNPHSIISGSVVENGYVAKSSHKSSKEELEAQKTNKAYRLANNDGRTVGDSSKSDRNESKGKAKAVNDRPIDCDSPTLKEHDDICRLTLGQNKRKSLSIPLQSASSPKRIMMVHNGCIAPNNAKAKQLEVSSVNGRANDGITQSGGSRVVIDVDEVYSKETDATRAKGKGVVVLPFSPKGHEDSKGNTGSFVDERYKGKLKGIDCRVEQDNNKSNNTILGKCCSSSEPVVLQNEGQFRTSSRRQKSAEVICLSSCGESSNFKTMDHGRRPPRHLGSPIVVGELSLNSTERETQSEVRDQQLHADEMLARELQEQLYNEIPEASVLGGHFPVVGGQQLQQDNTWPAPRGGRDSYTSVGLEQQLQQAINALPVSGGGYDSNATGHFPVIVGQQLQQHNTLPASREGNDSYSATVLEHQLQQADNTLPVPRGGYDSNARGVVPALNRRRQPQPQPLFQPRAQLLASTIARSRSRQHLHTSVPAGDRIGVRPSDAALEESMRWMEALERLEREQNVVHTAIWSFSQQLGPAWEFNENDYEMLLGLDENNHHHLGASVSQIRNLPESIVQSEGSDTCTICLEIPTIGETIRHLPCLHKFHKGCIDRWLERKRSCPICKSDV